jgi:membrane-bound lytic murein transglycosylase B
MTTELMARRLIAAALLLAAALSATPALAQSQGQSQGNGLSNLFGGIFSGSKPDVPTQQPQAAPGTSAPLPWSGEDGASGRGEF